MWTHQALSLHLVTEGKQYSAVFALPSENPRSPYWLSSYLGSSFISLASSQGVRGIDFSLAVKLYVTHRITAWSAVLTSTKSRSTFYFAVIS